MNWPDSISEALPPERDDEPASLRDDIADELADHLEAAFTRERSRCKDDAAARKAVLRRFGNPTSIGRRLWFDAMKGTIMLQRFAVVTQAILAVCCLGALGLMWQMMRQNQQVNLVFQERLAELVLKSNPAAMEWTSLKIKCVSGPDNTPVVGCRVYVGGHMVSASKNTSVTRVSDQNGAVYFETIRVGEYGIEVTDSLGRQNQREFTLFPGGATEVTIKCPTSETKRTKIRFNLGLKNTPENTVTLTKLQFLYQGELVDGHRWKTIMSSPVVVLTSDGKVIFQQIGRDHLTDGFPPGDPKPTMWDVLTRQGGSTTVDWPIGDYQLVSVELARVKNATGEKAHPLIEETRRPNIERFEGSKQFKAELDRENDWAIHVPSLIGGDVIWSGASE